VGSVHSEIAIAVTPARQKQPYIAGISYLMFASLAAIVDGGLLTPIRSRSNQPSALQFSAWVVSRFAMPPQCGWLNGQLHFRL